LNVFPVFRTRIPKISSLPGAIPYRAARLPRLVCPTCELAAMTSGLDVENRINWLVYAALYGRTVTWTLPPS